MLGAWVGYGFHFVNSVDSWRAPFGEDPNSVGRKGANFNCSYSMPCAPSIVDWDLLAP